MQTICEKIEFFPERLSRFGFEILPAGYYMYTAHNGWDFIAGAEEFEQKGAEAFNIICREEI